MAVYQSEFQGATIDARLAAVATMQTAISNLASAVAAKYSKPSSGIPETDLDADVNAALAKANSAIQSLADYYTKTEVDALFAAVNSLDYVDVASLPTASASTLGKIYLVGPDGSGYYSYYYTSYDGTNYSWVGPLGTTEISMANYATKTELGQLDQKVGDLKVSPSNSDFEIKDDNQNAVLRLMGGDIKTKNFDSEKLPAIDDSLSDYEIADKDGNGLFRIRRGHIVTANFNSERTEENQMFGKRIVWYGTSIPAAGYPEVCGKYLKATVYNEAVGSSMCRMGMPYATPDNPLGDIYGIVGLGFTVVCTSLSMKQEEKHDVFVNWTTARRQANLIAQGYTAEQVANVKGWGELLTGNPPEDIMSSEYDNYRKMSYGLSYNSYTDIEPGLGLIPGKVDKYLNEESFPDLWVFDHGHNDNKDATAELMETIPTPFDDRHYFIGSVNFLINRILAYNPRARFIIIGHYDNDETATLHHERIVEAQTKLADYWNVPIFKTWEMSSVSRLNVVTTNAYWDADGVWHDSGFNGSNGYAGVHYDGVAENPRQVDGVWVHDMSTLWVHMLDGLHPTQEEYKDFLGHSMAKHISSLIVNF